MHHINFAKASAVLREYRVREAKEPRNFKLTFKDTGFYRTLRKRVAKRLEEIDPTKGESMSKVLKICHMSLELKPFLTRKSCISIAVFHRRTAWNDISNLSDDRPIRQ